MKYSPHRLGLRSDILQYVAWQLSVDDQTCASPQTVDGCVTVATVNAACFNNPAKGDFMLRGSSPLIGKGSVSGYGDLAVSATDIAGEKRFSKNGKKISIGAYEGALKGLVIFLAKAL